VIRTTGRPFSSFGPGMFRYGETVFPVTLVGVWLPRAVLAQRIAERFAAMRDAGLVDEVRRMAESPGLSRTAAQAIGYKEVLAALAGDATIDDALDLAERRTRSFARRQRMWFRRDPRVRWLAAPENPHDVAPALLATWTAPTSIPASAAPFA
jgi:tRNA dimethylallyltransferase